MKDESSFKMVGAVAKVYVNDPKRTFAKLELETSVDGRRSVHELKGFKEMVEVIAKLSVGEMISVTGEISKMTSKEAEYANMPYREGKTEGSKFYPYVPVLSLREITRISGGNSDSSDDDDKVPD